VKASVRRNEDEDTETSACQKTSGEKGWFAGLKDLKTKDETKGELVLLKKKKCKEHGRK